MVGNQDFGAPRLKAVRLAPSHRNPTAAVERILESWLTPRWASTTALSLVVVTRGEFAFAIACGLAADA